MNGMQAAKSTPKAEILHNVILMLKLKGVRIPTSMGMMRDAPTDVTQWEVTVNNGGSCITEGRVTGV